MSILLYRAVTSLRVGEGSAIGAVDLPVARERHTGWPYLPGSSIKGALRSRAHKLNIEQNEIDRVFGTEPEVNPGTLGEKTFLPATLLALPVRTPKGGFVLLTCPMALARFARVADKHLKIPQPAVDVALMAPNVAKKFVWNVTGQKVECHEGVMFLEDMDWILDNNPLVKDWADYLKEYIEDGFWEHLAVVHDDLFSYACSAWTQVRTRSSIGEDGVVKDAALFTVESLPQETIFWSEGELYKGDKYKQYIIPKNGETWTIGSNQTTGYGRVACYGVQK